MHRNILNFNYFTAHIMCFLCPVFGSRDTETIWFPEGEATGEMNQKTIRKYPLQQLESQPRTHTLCLSACDKHPHTEEHSSFLLHGTHIISHSLYTLWGWRHAKWFSLICYIHRNRLFVSTTLQSTQITRSWTLNSHVHKLKQTHLYWADIHSSFPSCPPWTDGNIDSGSRGNKRGNRVVRGDDGGLRGWWLSVSDLSPVRLSSCRDIWPHSWFLTQIELMGWGEFRWPYSPPHLRLSTHSVGYLSSPPPDPQTLKWVSQSRGPHVRSPHQQQQPTLLSQHLRRGQ